MATDPKRDELVGCDGSVNGSTRTDYGPMFDMKPENWDEWQFLAMLHLDNKGLAPWVDGTNRAEMTSADASIAAKYQVKNRELFRQLLRMMDLKSQDGKEMLLKIRDEFAGDADGHELWEYLRQWACELSSAEVKLLHMDIRALKFSASESPSAWEYKMQLLLKKWKRIPTAKRGGTISDLSEMLLDKVMSVPACVTYVQYVRAFSAVNGKSLDDYQGVAKMLVGPTPRTHCHSAI